MCMIKVLLICRACVVFNDRLYVLGGQEGDFKAKPGSPIFKCSRQREVSNSLQITLLYFLFLSCSLERHGVHCFDR